MKKILFAAAVSTLGLASAAQAAGGCGSPYCNGGGFFGSRGGHGLPAFQAAPWYLYWPYNNHFMTPAPMGGHGHYGAYGAPGGGLTNPYFPGGGMPGGGYSYPSTPPAAMPSTTLPPNSTVPPAPMPQLTPPPAATPPTGVAPGVTPAPTGATPPVTPKVSVPVIPAVPGGVIRTSGR